MQTENIKKWWKKVKLWDVSKLEYWYWAPATNNNTWYKYLRITDITWNIIDYNSIPFCEISKKDYEKYKLSDWDIVIARTWATAWYAKLIKNPVNTVFAWYLINSKLDKNIAIPWFVWAIIESKIFKDFINQNKWWSAQPHANVPVIKEFSFLLPPLESQQKIASILSKYDDLIENNTKRIKILEQTAQEIYKEWFVNFRFPGYENVNMVDSGCEFWDIPEGWEVKKINELWKVITWKTPSTKNPKNFWNYMQFIKTPDLHWNIFCIKTEQNLSEEWVISQKNKILPVNSIVVSCIWTVWVVSITSELSQTNQQINALVLDNLIYLEFMYLKFKWLKQHLVNIWWNWATMTNVNKDKFENIEIIVPNNELMTKFNLVINPLFNEILVLQKQNQNLKQTRDMLIPKLVSGEVDVDDLDIKI